MGINKYRDMETDLLESNVGKIGTPGLSERQKSQQRSNAQRIAAQQAQIQQRELNRLSLAQGAGWQGGYAQQAHQLANSGAQAGAQAGFQAEQMSQQVAAARDAQIRADMARQSDITRDNWQTAIKTGLELNKQGIEAGKEGAGAAVASMVSGSDRRLKQNIESVGVDSATGLNIYDFEYKSDPSRRFRGVMADEVEVDYPEAVIYGDDGFAKVHYGLLGLEMTEI